MNTLQINCMMESGTNQLAALASAHYFDQPIQEPRTYFRLARPDEEQISLTYRARSYLHANCAFCHYNGSAIGSWDASITNTLDRAQIVNGVLRDALGNPENVVLKPGNLMNSALHTRMTTRDDLRMPPVGSNELDERGIALMTEWINSLTNWVSYAEWRAYWFTPGDPEGGEDSNPDGDALNNRLEWLFGESPTVVSLVDKLDVIPEANGRLRLKFMRHAGIGHQLERTVDLPEVDWQTILNLQNDPLPLSSNRLESIILDVLPGVDTEFFRLLYIEP
jgi:hypothetical protein